MLRFSLQTRLGKTLLPALLTVCSALPSTAAEVSPAAFIRKLSEGTPQRMVVYGTSLTAGGAWSSQVKAALDASYPGLLTLVNSGGSGMTSVWGVDNLQTRVINQNPDVVFIEFAVNDATARFNISLDQSHQNLLHLISTIRAARPACEIILQVMSPVIDRPEGHDGWRPHLHLYQQIYRDVAAENDLLVIDHMPAWQAVLDEGDSVYRGYTLSADGLHPNATGYERFVTPVILGRIGARVTPPPSLIVDNPGPGVTTTGTWTASNATAGYQGSDYLHDGNEGKGRKSVTYTPDIPFSGTFPLYLKWTSYTNRASNVPVTIHHAGGSQTVTVNQTANGGQWRLLGTFPFDAGTGGSVVIRNDGTNGHVIADAIAVGIPSSTPTVTLYADNARPAEPSPGRTAVLTLGRDGPLDVPLTVQLSISGSAGNGADYDTLPASVTIPAGDASINLTLQPLADTLAEGEETIRIGIAPHASYQLATPNKVSLLLQDHPYDSWKLRSFDTSQLADPDHSGDLSDPDQDGLANLLEYFTGRLPHLHDAGDAIVTGAETIGGHRYLHLIYDRLIESGLQAVVETSSDLSTWDSGPDFIQETVLSDDGLIQRRKARSLHPIGGGEKEFIRLRVIR